MAKKDQKLSDFLRNFSAIKKKKTSWEIKKTIGAPQG